MTWKNEAANSFAPRGNFAKFGQKQITWVLLKIQCQNDQYHAMHKCLKCVANAIVDSNIYIQYIKYLTRILIVVITFECKSAETPLFMLFCLFF